MPFGLINAPQIFSVLMSRVSTGQEVFTLAYLNDILIFSEPIQYHGKIRVVYRKQVLQ